MSYFSKKSYNFIKFEKSNRMNKMYDAILLNKKTNKTIKLSFGDSRYENYHDLTGLNLYPHLTHGDKKRRKSYRARHIGFLKKGYYSPGYLSYNYLW